MALLSVKPMCEQRVPSSSSGRGRDHHPPRRPRRASCRQHHHGRWGWTWELKCNFPQGCPNVSEACSLARIRRWNWSLWRWMRGALREESHQVSGPGPTIQGQSMGIAGEEDSCPWVLESNWESHLLAQELNWEPGEEQSSVAITTDPLTGRVLSFRVIYNIFSWLNAAITQVTKEVKIQMYLTTADTKENVHDGKCVNILQQIKAKNHKELILNV